MVTVAVSGERCEIEFLSDGSVDVEKFVSQGDVAGEEALSELFDRFSESENTIESSEATGFASEAKGEFSQTGFNFRGRLGGGLGYANREEGGD